MTQSIALDAPLIEIAVADPTSKIEIENVIKSSGNLAAYPEQEIVITSSTNILIPPSTLAATLKWETDTNLWSGANRIHFLLIDNLPYGIVISVNDDVSSLGGLLRWEDAMRDDLRTLLSLATVPAESFTFVDRTLGTYDLRVLTDGTEDVLVYGFINQNQDVITRSTGAFLRVAQ